MSLDKLKRNLYSILKEQHGPDITIKKVDLTSGNMEYLEYKVIVEHKISNTIKETTYDVTTLMMESGIPYTINGKLTKAGKKICDDLAELGEIIGAIFN